jgi:glycosyltransferase involved in cell wall biosynthesis
MKICVVNEFFRPHITGGTEIFLEHLIDYLLSKGFEIDVITNRFKNEKEYEKEGNFTLHRVNSSPITFRHMKQLPGVTLPFNFFNFTLKEKLRKIIRSCDCVHVNNLYHLSFAPVEVANDLNKHVILDVHDYWPVCFKKNLFFLDKIFCEELKPFKCLKCLMSTNTVSTLSYPILNPLVTSELFLRNKFLRFDELITHSKFVGKIMEKKFKIKPMVISYPYIGKLFTEKRKTIGGKINLLFVGRVEYLKGAHLLIPVAKILKGRNIPYKINAIGSGILIDKLKTESMKMGLNIEFHGFVKHMSQKFIKIMKESHILLVPSLWYEPFGIVVLDAMVFGMPIIASDRGGLKEIVHENDVGVTTSLNPKDIVHKIEFLINDKTVFKRFSSNGLKNIKRYNSKDIFKKYEILFEKFS